MNKNLFLVGLGVLILIAAGLLHFKEKPAPLPESPQQTVGSLPLEQTATSTASTSPAAQ